MAVALGNLGCAVDASDTAAALYDRGVGAEPHGAAEVAAGLPLLQLVALEPFGHQADHRLRRGAEFRRVRLSDAAEIARSLDHGHLHAETDAEVGHFALARELRCADL